VPACIGVKFAMPECEFRFLEKVDNPVALVSFRMHSKQKRFVILTCIFNDFIPDRHACTDCENVHIIHLPSILVGMPSTVWIKSCDSLYLCITNASSTSSTNCTGARESGVTRCKHIFCDA
jgi:hypothetical protein